MARVLCIESDSSTREQLVRLLERAGMSVEASGGGLDGLAHALAAPPDLVVAGTRLPDLSGAELALRLRGEPRLAAIPALALGRQAAERPAALAAGFDLFFLLEPPLDARLVAEVEAALAGKRERLGEQEELARLRTLAQELARRIGGSAADATQARDRLAELDRSRSAFMRDLAHEISTPLTPLAGYLKILQHSDKLGPLAPQQRKVVDAMSSAVAKLARIVDNLADFASLQAGGAAIVQSPVDPDVLAEEVVAELRPAVKESRLHVEVRPSRGGAVRADPRKLRQALANVVGNAVKFSPHGGEVLVEVARDAARVRFLVYDQGPGVQAADAERIFEPFFHRDAVGEARQPGSGLGLPVARRIAEAHGGRAFVESPPHTQPAFATHQYAGSKFVLEIPAEPVAASPAEASG